jgi:2-oxoisovalerate dehydrogenase E1 component
LTDSLLTAPEIASALATVNPTREELRRWYSLMHLGRVLDDKAPNYLKQGLGWSYHAPCAGHDGIQVALGTIFRPAFDYLFPYYRDLTTCLSAGVTPEQILLNGMSKASDVASGGRHMSNHFARHDLYVWNVSSCVSNHAQHAAGLGRAIRSFGMKSLVYCSMGESSTSEGYFYEAVNGCSLGKLPVIFVIQDNGYGISVPKRQQTANHYASDNFASFPNLRVIHCDGKDILDSVRALREAAEFAQSGAGCVLVHADCVRIHSHSNSDRHELYRDEEELTAARELDPLPRFRRLLVEGGAFSEEEIRAIEDENRQAYETAADRARSAPDPDPKSIHDFVLPEPWVPEGDGLATVPRTPATAPDGRPHSESSMIHAINETMKDLFRENQDTFIWGQDVASGEKGGIFNVTKGMEKEFGSHRVFNAPIAEDYILGMADGFSRVCDGVRVIVEGAEFADYFWPAAEQMVEMSHEYWRTNGQFVPNVTVRLASGGYIGGGLYHSQNIEGWLTTLPGIRIVVPAFADDAAGLLRTAVRSRGIEVPLQLSPLEDVRPGRLRGPVREGAPAPSGERPDGPRVRNACPLGTPGGHHPRRGGKRGRGPRSPLARPARLRRHRRLGEEDVPRPHRPRGQGEGGLRRRAVGPGDERALRVPRRSGRAGRIALHPRRIQPDPRAGDPAEHRNRTRGGAEAPRLLMTPQRP